MPPNKLVKLRARAQRTAKLIKDGTTLQDGQILTRLSIEIGKQFKGVRATMVQTELSFDNSVIPDGWYPSKDNGRKELHGQNMMGLSPGFMGSAIQFQRTRPVDKELQIHTDHIDIEDRRTVKWTYNFNPCHTSLARLDFLVILNPRGQPPDNAFTPFTITMSKLTLKNPPDDAIGRPLGSVQVGDLRTVQVERREREQYVRDAFEIRLTKCWCESQYP